MNASNQTPSYARYLIRHIFGSLMILVIAAVLGSCFLVTFTRSGMHHSETAASIGAVCGTLYAVGAMVAASAWLGTHLSAWDEARKPTGSYVAITPITPDPDKKKHATPDDFVLDPAFHIEGRGSQAADPVELSPGLYRLRYDLPPRAPTTISALGLVSHATITILDAKNGAGSITFDIEEPDRYVFQVEIAAKTPRDWAFDFERI